MTETKAYITVILPLKLNWEPYYRLPEGLDVQIGDRVNVSFAHKGYIGVVSAVNVMPDIEDEKILAVESVESELPGVLESEIQLWRSVAEYYMCSVGEVYKAAYPLIRTRTEQKKARAAKAGKNAELAGEIILSEAQSKACGEIKAAFAKPRPVLLQGVTGSGKTEIYISLAKECLASGRNVLYLVPEIALSMQLEQRLEKHFGDSLSVYNSSRQAATKRNIANRIRSATDNYIVLGTRSALFLPHNRLGLIIVDEEHDASYKQDSPAPRYNGRDVAAMLAAQEGCNLLLGSATPSLESIYNHLKGKYALVRLSEKYYGSEDSETVVIDTGAEWKKRGMKGNFSIKLIERIQACLAVGEQVLILRSRRAYASVLQCKDCGEILKCPHCNVPLSYHKENGMMLCHSCGYRSAYSGVCPSCGSRELALLGAGTQKIEEEAATLFPQARIERLDSDVTRSRESAIIREFSKGNIDILIGTQMIAKGFDFENLSLVAVIGADSLLGIQDFRADEKAFNLLSQFRGRSSRRGKKGTFVIQTAQSTHPVYSSFNGENVTDYLLAERRDFGYPPFSRIISLTISDRIEDRAQRMAAALSDILHNNFEALSRTLPVVIGPFSPAADKVADEYHRCIRITLPKDRNLFTHKEKIKSVILAFEKSRKYDGHITINVDPA
ncbi:MAG: primosomal protein N' [Candidatus Cryptobacteroides sp.]